MRDLRSLLRQFLSGEGLRAQLLRGGAGSIAVRVGSTLVSVLLAIVLARALGVENFGVYSFVLALITTMAIPAQMGLPNLVVRETAKAQAVGDWDLVGGLWRWSTLMALVMSAALTVVGATAAWVFTSNLPNGGQAVFYWGLVLVPLIALGNLRGAALRGLRKVIAGQLPEYIVRPALLILLVLAVTTVTVPVTAATAIGLHAFASGVAFLLGAWLLLRARPPELRLRRDRTLRVRPRAWLASAIPMAMVEGSHVVNQNAGLLLLGLLATIEDVALFRVAMQGSLLVSFGLAAAKLVVAPHMARLHQQQEMGRLQRLVTWNARLSLLISAPIALTFLIAGRELVVLAFGPEYEAAYWPLVILSAGQVVNAFGASVGVLLTMTGHERDTALATVVSTALTVLLTLLLAPRIGAIGAAIAAAASLVVWQGLMWWRARRNLGLATTAIGPHARRASS